MAKTTNIGLNLLFIGKIKHIIQLYKTQKTLYSPNQTILNVDFKQRTSTQITHNADNIKVKGKASYTYKSHPLTQPATINPTHHSKLNHNTNQKYANH